jgi:hypothetical protein
VNEGYVVPSLNPVDCVVLLGVYRQRTNGCPWQPADFAVFGYSHMTLSSPCRKGVNHQFVDDIEASSSKIKFKDLSHCRGSLSTLFGILKPIRALYKIQVRSLTFH